MMETNCDHTLGNKEHEMLIERLKEKVTINGKVYNLLRESVAQRLEQCPGKAKVVGSNPTAVLFMMVKFSS